MLRYALTGGEEILYTAIGYPVSRNKNAIDHATKSVTTRISMYTANVEAGTLRALVSFIV
jgi:hypothetical protein